MFLVAVLSDNSHNFILDVRLSQLHFSNPGFENWDGDLVAFNDDEIDALLNAKLQDTDCDVETKGISFVNYENVAADPPNEDHTGFELDSHTTCLLVPDHFTTAPCTNSDDNSVLFVSARLLVKPLRA